MKILFIDDSAEYLRSVNVSLGYSLKGHQIITAECHGVGEAVEAIRRAVPDVVFLDHHLTDEDAPDGIMVLDRLGEISARIFSTTSDPRFRAEYQQRGIVSVRKGDLAAIREAVKGIQEG